MKYAILITSLIFSSLLANSQQLHLVIDSVSKKYTYSEVIKCDSTLNDTLLYYQMKEWASSQGLNLNRLKDDKGNDKAIMSAVFGTRYVNFTSIDLQYKNKNVIKSDQAEIKKLILNGVYKYTSNLWGCLQTCYTNFDVLLQCRKGRVKITFTNYTIDQYNTNTAEPLPNSGITLEELIQAELPKTGKPCHERVSEYSIELQGQCEAVLNDLKKYTLNLKPATKDDW